jgi:uncharacterized protein (DUF983 family)
MDESGYPPLSPLKTGLACRCPRCGRGRLYAGFLTLAPACPVCHLDYAKADSGDGPAVFIILLLGAIVVAAALIVEVRYEPPYWVHMALWPPLVLGGALALLRPLKAMMIAQQYRHAAAGFGEGRN